MSFVEPARIEYRADGVPMAPAFGDVYHSAAGGFDQARHVFLAGNQLPERWRGRSRFVIVETGFGLGTNFLATWAAWRADAARCDRLFFVSVDRYPPSREDLARSHGAMSAHADLAQALARAWPPLIAGWHRLAFDDDRVVLLLGLGDAQALLSGLDVAADAFYLDGFAPAKNPAMWSQGVFDALRALAAEGATAATWSAARIVRDGLAAAGFAVERAAGFAHKRDMTIARIAGDASARSRTTMATPARIAIVGAGLAACSLAYALRGRGCEVAVFDTHAAPASGTSGNRMGVIQPRMSRADTVASRFTRAAFLHAIARLRALNAEHDRWASLQGVLHLPKTDAQFDALHAWGQTWPDDFARVVSNDEATHLAGVPVARGGWWFAHGGWVAPGRYAHALFDASGARFQGGVSIARIERAPEGVWRLIDAYGVEHATVDAVVIAAGARTRALLDALHAAPLPIRAVRGQLTHVDAHAFAPPRVPVTGDGYVLPPWDSQCVVGASYEYDDDPNPTPRPAVHLANLARIERLLGQTVSPEAASAGRVAWRAVTPDRLPVVGPVPSAASPHDAIDGVYVFSGLASRGITWCGLSAEVLVARLMGDPCPVERELAEAIVPKRF
ncbi:MAG TPA: FAD-dependent 5-carboxymethylaminomethyl-2-thiouridine(34) oxidoreductase MnmC [Burkholderiaceae bacterium]|nr:FAD-dependent 5-carboxymethylaminomethyl-2-thiouridine(34) oxidoreductase MnmC [Burkholderiaceae bacterium]